MKKILSMLIALILTAAMLCGGASAEMIKDGEFTIYFCTWIGYAPLYIAQANGYFENYGINPTLTINEDESTYAAAMFSKSVSSLGQVWIVKSSATLPALPKKCCWPWMNPPAATAS